MSTKVRTTELDGDTFIRAIDLVSYLREALIKVNGGPESVDLKKHTSAILRDVMKDIELIS